MTITHLIWDANSCHSCCVYLPQKIPWDNLLSTTQPSRTPKTLPYTIYQTQMSCAKRKPHYGEEKDWPPTWTWSLQGKRAHIIIASTNHKIVTCHHKMVTCHHKMVTRHHKMVTRHHYIKIFNVLSWIYYFNGGSDLHTSLDITTRIATEHEL